MRILIAALVLLFALPAAAEEAPAPVAPPPPAPAAPSGPRILVQTSMGDITIALDSAHAPLSVANVLRYVREGHYDGTAIYRVAKGFVIQMGSYDPAGHYRATHDPIALEANNGLSNVRGAVALARLGDPNSATADFFIDLVDNTGLDHSASDTGNTTGYAVFGQVVSGMDVADRIAEVPVGNNGPMPGQAPVTPIIVSKVSILPNAVP